MALAPGELIGRNVAGYRIDAWLGSGGNADIYLATHRQQQRKVALKLLSAKLRQHPGALERFMLEGELMASLDHPNIPRVLERGEGDGRLYIAMTYAEGCDLMQLLERDGPLPLARAISIVEQLARALDALHTVSLVHVDVKLTNILAGSDGQIYLIDFGRARRLIERDASLEALDIAALANVAYRCLVGVPATELEALEENRNGIRPVSTVRPDVPPSVDDVLEEATARPATNRYPTAGELARGLRRAAAQPAAEAPA